MYNPTPNFSLTVQKNNVQKLANCLIEMDENSYLANLLMSKNCQACPFETLHQAMPLKNQPYESMHLNINNSSSPIKYLRDYLTLQLKNL